MTRRCARHDKMPQTPGAVLRPPGRCRLAVGAAPLGPAVTSSSSTRDTRERASPRRTQERATWTYFDRIHRHGRHGEPAARPRRRGRPALRLRPTHSPEVELPRSERGQIQLGSTASPEPTRPQGLRRRHGHLQHPRATASAVTAGAVAFRVRRRDATPRRRRAQPVTCCTEWTRPSDCRRTV